MTTNNINIVMKTVVVFLVTRSDVSHPRCPSSKSNDNIYAMLRYILRYFNM